MRSANSLLPFARDVPAQTAACENDGDDEEQHAATERSQNTEDAAAGRHQRRPNLGQELFQPLTGELPEFGNLGTDDRQPGEFLRQGRQLEDAVRHAVVPAKRVHETDDQHGNGTDHDCKTAERYQDCCKNLSSTNLAASQSNTG